MNKTAKNNFSETARYIVALVAACTVFAIMQGIHDNYGIMLRGIVEQTGKSYESVSFVIAVGQILYGVAPPLFGVLALKKSNAFVMLCGILLMAAGLIATPFCSTLFGLLLFLGIILPAGTGALCAGIVIGAIAPIVGEKRAVAASGILQASAGIGDAFMSPILQRLTDWFGINISMPAFSIPILLTVPVVIWLGAAAKKQNRLGVQKDKPEENKKEGLFSILRSVSHDRTYWCIVAGFSTCGFHMAIIETHLYSQYVSCGIERDITSLVLTVYGIFTMIGAVVTGWLGQKLRMKNVLGTVYAIRIFIALGFIFLPKTIPFAFVATAFLGMTGDATVPPTMGIVSKKVGVAKMAVVYGSALFGHQIGAFISAWLGGIFVSTSLGYTALWIADLILAAFAAFMSYRIKD